MMETKHTGGDIQHFKEDQLAPSPQDPNPSGQQPSQPMQPYQQPPIQPSQPEPYQQPLMQPAPAPPPGQPGQQQANWQSFMKMRGMHQCSGIMIMIGGFLCFTGLIMTVSGYIMYRAPTGVRVMGPLILCTGLALVVTAIAMCILLRKEMQEKQTTAIYTPQQPVVVGMAPSGQTVSYQPPAPGNAYNSSEPIATEPVYPTAPPQAGMRQADLVAPPTYDEAIHLKEVKTESEYK